MIPESPRWLECAGCGLIRPDHTPTPAQFDQWYRHDPTREGPSSVGIPPQWKHWFLQQLVVATITRGWRRWPRILLAHPFAGHFQGIPSKRRRGALLDVGCGDGGWGAILQSCGWQVTGIELDPQRAAAARGHGISVWEGDCLAFPAAPASFDVVRLWHVLEHLPDPAQALRRARQWLVPGGEMIIGVPNIRGIPHQWFRGAWSGLEYPKHLHHFTDRAIVQLLKSTGFVETRIRHRSCGTCLDSLRNCFPRVGPRVAVHPLVRLGSVYLDRLLDLCRVGDAFDVRATQ